MRIKQTLILLIFMVSLLGLPGIAAAKTDKVSKTDNNVVTTASDKIIKKDTVKTSAIKQKNKKTKHKKKHKKKHNTNNSKGGKGRK